LSIFFAFSLRILLISSCVNFKPYSFAFSGMFFTQLTQASSPITLTLSATKVGRFLLLAHREPSKQWVCHHPVNTPFPLGERRLCWHPHGGCVLFSPLSPSQTLQLPTIIILSYFLISFLGDSSPRLKSGAFSPRFCKKVGPVCSKHYPIFKRRA